MKLEYLLLKRAAATNDARTILHIFAEHFPSIDESYFYRDWQIVRSGFLPPHSLMLETPYGSFHYAGGHFYEGDHNGAFSIVYSRNFDDVLL